MFSSDAKAATLLETYQVLAEEVRSLAEMEASYDVPDEDVAEAIAHLGRAMRCVAGARAFCVCLSEAPRAPRDLPPDERYVSGCSFDAALARAAQAGAEAVEKATASEESDLFPVLNRPSPDRPVRFNAGGIGVWAKTQREAEQILADTRAALLPDEAEKATGIAPNPPSASRAAPGERRLDPETFEEIPEVKP